MKSKVQTATNSMEQSPWEANRYTFPTFQETRRFNTVFTKAHHWSLSWAGCIQSTPLQTISL